MHEAGFVHLGNGWAPAWRVAWRASAVVLGRGRGGVEKHRVGGAPCLQTRHSSNRLASGYTDVTGKKFRAHARSHRTLAHTERQFQESTFYHR